jgi:transposase-like protein
LVEFEEFFPDEDSCQRYLERLKWPDGFVCPACGEVGQAWRARRGVLLCPHCRKETSVTAGTIFEGTRKPLRLWFLVVREITSQKYGANALGIQRILGLKSYRTAWAWLHKLRRAMVRPGRSRLGDEVEVDECYVGAEEAGLRGRQTIQKAIVAIAVEFNDGQIGRIRMRHVPNVSAKSLVGFVTDVVEPGSVVRTDGWPSYSRLGAQGFHHRVAVLSASPDPAHVLMPSVHRVASLLKRWVRGTLQGGISKEHLPYYLDEFTFRFNRRSSRARGMLFYRLLEQAVRTGHIATHDLFKGTGRGRRRSKSCRSHKG